MEEYFNEFEIEVSKSFNLTISSTPFIFGENPFLNSSSNKIYKHEIIVINGKKKLIRRLFLKNSKFLFYSLIGWVLNYDINFCMICCKKFTFFFKNNKKKHCKVCGNIICINCLIGMVKIKEFQSQYVEACSNCYWGQDEVSILSITSLIHQNNNSYSGNTINNMNINTENTNKVIKNEDFYSCYDIEEYDGPATLDPSILNLSSNNLSLPRPLINQQHNLNSPTTTITTMSSNFYPRVDSLCYSDGITRWSDTGSLVGDSMTPSPIGVEIIHPNEELKVNPDSYYISASSEEDEDEFQERDLKNEIENENENEDDNNEECNEEEQDDNKDSEKGENEIFDEIPDEDLLGVTTANQAQLMLLLMSLSIANPVNITEEEAIEYNEIADKCALEKLNEEDGEIS